MKIIHCADLHLDSKMESIFPNELSKIRKAEILETFKNMVRYAKENDINIVMISGDMFDSSLIQEKVKDFVIDIINEYCDIDFLYLCGNHDENSFINSLKIKPNNLKIFNSDWTYYRYNNLVIAGCELNDVNNKLIYTSLDLNINDVNIVMLHGQDSAYDIKNESNIIYIKSLQNKNIDYCALGHIHSYKVGKIDNRGIYVYSGCLEGRGFDETLDKGFVEITIEDKKIKHKFIKFAKRTLHEINVDITGIESLRNIQKAITDKTDSILPDDLVKVNLVGTFTTNTKKDIINFENMLKEKFFFARVKDKTKIKINIDDYKYDVSVIGEFIRTVLSSDETEEDKGDIITLGLRALRGEDIE